MEANMEEVIPTKDRVFCKLKENEKVKGGIIIPDLKEGWSQEADVISVGEDSDKEKPCHINKGDTVLIDRFAGDTVMSEGKVHKMLVVDAVVAKAVKDGEGELKTPTNRAIIPCTNHIVCKPILADDTFKTDTGVTLYRADTARDRNFTERAEVVCIGEYVDIKDLGIGDIVIFRKGQGEWTHNVFEIDRQKYYIINDEDILGFIKVKKENNG